MQIRNSDGGRGVVKQRKVTSQLVIQSASALVDIVDVFRRSRQENRAPVQDAGSVPVHANRETVIGCVNRSWVIDQVARFVKNDDITGLGLFSSIVPKNTQLVAGSGKRCDRRAASQAYQL